MRQAYTGRQRFMLDIEVSEVGDTTICQLSGYLDGVTAAVFRRDVSGCLARSALVIDLSFLRFIDGAGLTALVGAIRTGRDRSCEVVVTSGTALRAVLTRCGLHKIVLMLPTVEAALEGLSGETQRQKSRAFGRGMQRCDDSARARNIASQGPTVNPGLEGTPT
jgi:anti-anti-sigma factor